MAATYLFIVHAVRSEHVMRCWATLKLASLGGEGRARPAARDSRGTADARIVACRCLAERRRSKDKETKGRFGGLQGLQ
ncbi:hypothetical protein C8Q76DRAFT_122836 [Earliella scabrosa]|nr:hypothetical protein C8Q76DRAFT_122836 [Earliella scabrosa]